MTELLWTCGSGTELSSTASGYRLTVRRLANGFEFQIVPNGSQRDASAESGVRADLREAVDAAERALAGIVGERNARQKLMAV